MQFSAVLLALAASASAAVLPRQEMGQWAVTASVGPAPGYVYLHAEFTSDEYPGDKKLRSTCVEAPNAELPVAHRCDRAAFDFQWDGKGTFLLSHHSRAELTFISSQRSTNSSQRCHSLRFRPLRWQQRLRWCHPRREGHHLNQMTTSLPRVVSWLVSPAIPAGSSCIYCNIHSSSLLIQVLRLSKFSNSSSLIAFDAPYEQCE